MLIALAEAAVKSEEVHEFSELPLSFADGVSLCVMRQRGIQHAFAFDPHFAQAGFVRIPVDLAL